MNNISLNVDMGDLARSLVDSAEKDGELLDFIEMIDLGVAEVDFTEKLIKRLVKSLKQDLTDAELDEFINSLKKAS